MRIVTFNLRNLFAEGTHQIFDEPVLYTADLVKARVASVVATLTKLKADIILVNEIGSAELLQDIAAGLPGGFHSFMAAPEARGIANGVLYKNEPVAVESVKLEPSLPIFKPGESDRYANCFQSKRGLVHLTINYQGRPLHVIGLHFKSAVPMLLKDSTGQYLKPNNQTDWADGLIRSTIRRLAEARALRIMIDQMLMTDKDAQIVVAGDFNDVANSATVRTVMGAKDDFSGRLANACERVPEVARYTHIEDGVRKLIDFVLVSSALADKVTKVEIDNKNLPDQSNEPNAALLVDSDHAPVVVELE